MLTNPSAASESARSFRRAAIARARISLLVIQKAAPGEVDEIFANGVTCLNAVSAGESTSVPERNMDRLLNWISAQTAMLELCFRRLEHSDAFMEAVVNWAMDEGVGDWLATCILGEGEIREMDAAMAGLLRRMAGRE